MTVALSVSCCSTCHRWAHFQPCYDSVGSRQSVLQPGPKARYVKAPKATLVARTTTLTRPLLAFSVSVARGGPVRFHDRHGRHSHQYTHPLPASESDGHAAVRPLRPCHVPNGCISTFTFRTDTLLNTLIAYTINTGASCLACCCFEGVAHSTLFAGLLTTCATRLMHDTSVHVSCRP